MALYLDDQTRQSLREITSWWISEHPNDWKAKRLMDKLIEDDKRLAEMASCQHTTARYVGEKTCCEKCGAFFEPGMGEGWTNTSFKSGMDLIRKNYFGSQTAQPSFPRKRFGNNERTSATPRPTDMPNK